jgi:hypothetical protein
MRRLSIRRHIGTAFRFGNDVIDGVAEVVGRLEVREDRLPAESASGYRSGCLRRPRLGLPGLGD